MANWTAFCSAKTATATPSTPGNGATGDLGLGRVLLKPADALLEGVAGLFDLGGQELAEGRAEVVELGVGDLDLARQRLAVTVGSALGPLRHGAEHGRNSVLGLLEIESVVFYGDLGRLQLFKRGDLGIAALLGGLADLHRAFS